jgi:hypothetical protein
VVGPVATEVVARRVVEDQLTGEKALKCESDVGFIINNPIPRLQMFYNKFPRCTDVNSKKLLGS